MDMSLATKERISVELSGDLLAALDRIRNDLGLRSRASLIERLLEELLLVPETDEASEAVS